MLAHCLGRIYLQKIREDVKRFYRPMPLAVTGMMGDKPQIGRFLPCAP